MALQRACLLLFIVGNAALSLAAEPRPNMTEWKKAKASEKAAVQAAAEKEAKMAAVNKILSMLEEVQKEVLKAGEEEAAGYNKFACFCKDTTAEKTASINKGQGRRAVLSTDIGELSSKRDGLDEDITGFEGDIEKAAGEMKEAAAARKKELDLYTKNIRDLSGALEGLAGAIKSVKVSKEPSLLQLGRASESLQGALLLADALGFADTSTKRLSAALLQQAPEVPMEDYKFHSGDIIEQLEKLLNDFRAEKSTVDKEEVKAVAEHESYMQEKTAYTKAKNVAMEKAKKSRSDTIAEIEEKSEELSTVEADLRADKEYLMKLAKMCNDKAATWDQRTKVRADELSALTAAIGIIQDQVSNKTTAATVRLSQVGVNLFRARALASDEGYMRALEASAEAADADASPAPALLQRASVRRHGVLAAARAQRAARKEGRESPAAAQQAVMDFLTSEGKTLRSSLLVGLASKVALGDPLAKVKTLIQELVERLLQEAANEANQKGWCDKSIAEAEQKRDYAAEEVTELNTRMAKLEAEIDKLTQELKELEDAIAELKAKRSEADDMRKEEKDEHELTVKEAEAGLDAVSQAIDILRKFYGAAKKETVDLSLEQQGQSPADAAPDAGFDNGEAYTGSQDSAGGIMGMLDVIKSDFVRTITETQKAEAQARKEHLDFMTETGMSLAEKEMAEEQNKKYKDDAEEGLQGAESDLGEQTELLRTALKELMELKPTCIDTGMSYEDRVALREQEMAALKKAMCILENYGEMGPEGAGAEC